MFVHDNYIISEHVLLDKKTPHLIAVFTKERYMIKRFVILQWFTEPHVRPSALFLELGQKTNAD